MSAFSPGAWDSFFVANAGAAAALAGLVFVGVSINVEEIAGSRRLAGRALEAFTVLAGVLIVAVLVLVPEITRVGLGIALVIVGAILGGVVSTVERSAHANDAALAPGTVPRGSTAVRIALGQAATLPVLVAGVSLLADRGGGLYWLVPAVVCSYVGALTNAWVLLIEIRR